MAIEIVDLPIEKGDFPWFYIYVYQRVFQTFESWRSSKFATFHAFARLWRGAAGRYFVLAGVKNGRPSLK